MPLRYKIDVVEALKSAGYGPTKIRTEKILGESYMTQLRRGELVSWKAIDTICSLLNCQPGDIIEHVQDCVCDQCQGGTPGGSNAPDPTEMGTPGGSGLVRRSVITPVSPRKK